MPITYLVIFNMDQEIIYSKIIKYREAYGGEVSGEKWLAQFNKMKQQLKKYCPISKVISNSGTIITENWNKV